MKVVNADKLIEIIREKDFPKKGELHRIITQLAFEAPIGEIPQLDELGAQQIDMTNVFYPEPTQVMYYDGGRYITFGIAFQGYIINSLTGRLLRIQEILRNALDNGIELDDAIVELGWKNIFF